MLEKPDLSQNLEYTPPLKEIYLGFDGLFLCLTFNVN